MYKNYSNKDIEAIRHIRNHIMHYGRFPSVRDLMRELDYKSPRSAAIILDNLIEKGIIEKDRNGIMKLLLDESLKDNINHAQTVDIPLVGSAACGLPIFAEENIETYIPISIKIAKPSNRYFLLRAKGDSMNDVNINNGDLVLVRQQSVADNGCIVVALIDDEATIKEFHHKGNMIVLKPRSKIKKYQPIILTSDFRIQGIVETVIPNID